MRLLRRPNLWRAAAALLAAGAVGWVAGALFPGLARSPASADEDKWPPKISAEKKRERGQEVGDVRINGDLVLRLRAGTTEFSSSERAVVVAERLKVNLRDRDKMTVSAGFREGYHCVLVNETVLVTPLPDDLPDGVLMREGAETWAERISDALGLEVSSPEGAEAFVPSEPYKDKIVPILSVLSGTRIGVARVNGPSSAVDRTQAVAQLEARLLSSFQVQIYVPISTRVPGRTLDRVQGVAVTAVGDLRL